MNTRDISLKDYKLKILVCGPSGSGKTHFAGTFPRPYFFDVDDGMLTLRGKDVEYDTFSKYADLETMANRLENDNNYDTLVIDSLTRLSDLLMDRIQELNHSSKKIPTIPEYGIFFMNMRRLIEEFVSLDKHIIFTAHEELMVDGITGAVEAVPLMVTKLRFRLANYFDEAYRLSVGRVKSKAVYTLSTKNERRYTYVKSRLGILPDVIDNPSYQIIEEVIKGENRG